MKVTVTYTDGSDQGYSLETAVEAYDTDNGFIFEDAEGRVVLFVPSQQLASILVDEWPEDEPEDEQAPYGELEQETGQVLIFTGPASYIERTPGVFYFYESGHLIAVVSKGWTYYGPEGGLTLKD